MKRNWKTTALALGAVLALSVSAAAQTFTDVEPGAWYHDTVMDMTQRGYLEGKGGGVFDPEGKVTGGEFAAMVARAYYGDELALAKFRWDGSGPWWTPYANAMKFWENYDILVENIDFSAPLTREEAVNMVAKLLGDNAYQLHTMTFDPGELAGFTDASQADSKGALGAVCHYGIMQGKSDTYFGLQDTLTRAEAATILQNLADGTVVEEQPVASYAPGILLGETSHDNEASSGSAQSSWETVGQQGLYTDGQNLTMVSGSATGDTFTLDTYDVDSGALLSEKIVPKELPILGKIYKGEDNFYGVFGQDNREEDDDKIVYSIVKYDQNFNILDRLEIEGGLCRTIGPFHAGNCDVMEQDGQLVVHTARLRYLSSDGKNHQSQITFVVDTDTMELVNRVSDFQANHVSHSFDQLIGWNDRGHVLLDHGDGYPRALVIHQETNGSYQDTEILKMPGYTGENHTGVLVGGFAVTPNAYLTAINQEDFAKGGGNRDVKLLVTDVSTGKTKTHVMAACNSRNLMGGEPQLIPTAAGKFMMIWEEFNPENWQSTGVYSCVIDKDGNQITDTVLAEHCTLSRDYDAVLVGDKLAWTVEDGMIRVLHTLDVPATALVDDPDGAMHFDQETPEEEVVDPNDLPWLGYCQTPTDKITYDPNGYGYHNTFSIEYVNNSDQDLEGLSVTTTNGMFHLETETPVILEAGKTYHGRVSFAENLADGVYDTTFIFAGDNFHAQDLDVRVTCQLGIGMPKDEVVLPELPEIRPDKEMAEKYNITLEGLDSDIYVEKIEEDHGYPLEPGSVVEVSLSDVVPNGLELGSVTVEYGDAKVDRYWFGQDKNDFTFSLDQWYEGEKNIQVTCHFIQAHRVFIKAGGALNIRVNGDQAGNFRCLVPGDVITIHVTPLNVSEFYATDEDGNVVEPDRYEKTFDGETFEYVMGDGDLYIYPMPK